MFTCKCLICGAEIRLELPERVTVCNECKDAIKFVKEELLRKGKTNG